MKYKIISTGNIILADQAFMDANHPGDYTALPDAPAPPAPEVLDTTWLLDVGSYYDRFGLSQFALLNSIDPILSGAVKSSLPRNYVDLQRPDVQAVVMYAAGATVPLGPNGADVTIAEPIITMQLASEVLTTSPAPLEQVAALEFLRRVGLL